MWKKYAYLISSIGIAVDSGEATIIAHRTFSVIIYIAFLGSFYCRFG